MVSVAGATILGMSSATLQLSDRFPVGAAVAAFPASLVGEPALSPFGAVPGGVSRAAVGVVASDGTVTLDGLDEGVVYVATQAERGVVVELIDDVAHTWKVTVANAGGGTFTLLADTDETSDLAYNASAGTIQSAIRTATGGSTETVTGSGGVFTVTLADGAVLTADDSSLTGSVTHTAFVRFSGTAYAAPARIPHPYGS